MLNGRFDDRHEKDVLFQKCNNESSQCKYCSGSVAPWLNSLTGCIIISFMVICQDGNLNLISILDHSNNDDDN